MFAELNFGFEEDLVGAAAAGAISLEIVEMVEVTKREGEFSSDGTPQVPSGELLFEPNPIGHIRKSPTTGDLKKPPSDQLSFSSGRHMERPTSLENDQAKKRKLLAQPQLLKGLKDFGDRYDGSWARIRRLGFVVSFVRDAPIMFHHGSQPRFMRLPSGESAIGVYYHLNSVSSTSADRSIPSQVFVHRSQ